MIRDQKPYYECHITYLGPVEAPPDWLRGRWIHSRIDGDPTLGLGVKSYLTLMFKDEVPLHEVIQQVEFQAQLIQTHWASVLRTKVEHVVYDRRVK